MLFPCFLCLFYLLGFHKIASAGEQTDFDVDLSRFDPCGIMLHYRKTKKLSSTYERGDLVNEILRNNTVISNRYIHFILYHYPPKQKGYKLKLPSIFRSQTFDCYLHVRVSNFREIYNSIFFLHVEVTDSPWKVIFKRAKIALLQKNHMLLYHSQLNEVSVKCRQLFVYHLAGLHIRFVDNIRNLKYSEEILFTEFSFWLYLCSFCTSPFIDENEIKGRESVINPTMFKSSWDRWNSEHYFQITEGIHNYWKSSLNCATSDFIDKLISKLCHDKEVFIDTLIHASKLNITLYYLLDKDVTSFTAPGIFLETLNQFEDPLNQFYFRSLDRYSVNKVAYCIYEKTSFEAINNIWFMHISHEVWVTFMITIVVLGSLKLVIEIKKCKCSKINAKSFIENICIGMKMLLRQSTDLSSFRYFICLELALLIVLVVYENFVTVELVVPSQMKTFYNITELIKNDYKYLYYNTAVPYSTHEWVKDEFNTKNRQYTETLMPGEDIYSIPEIKKYFGHPRNGSKYMFSGNDVNGFNKDLVGRIDLVLHQEFDCRILEPEDYDFNANPVFLTFESIISVELIKVHSEFVSHGLDVHISKMNRFADTIHRNKMHQEIIKDENFVAKIHKNVEHIWKSRTISLPNCASVFYFGLVLTVLSVVSFLMEMSETISGLIFQVF